MLNHLCILLYHNKMFYTGCFFSGDKTFLSPDETLQQDLNPSHWFASLPCLRLVYAVLIVFFATFLKILKTGSSSWRSLIALPLPLLRRHR